MRRSFGLWYGVGTALVGLALAAGCEKQDQQKTQTPAGGTSTPTTMPSGGMSSSAGSSMSGQMDRMASGVKPTTQPAAGAMRDAQSAASGAAAQASDTVAGAAQDAQGQAASAPEGVTTQAQTLLDQTMQYIKDNKWDLAEQSLTKLEAMKPQLPAAWQPRVDQARSALNAAKSGGNLKDIGSNLLQGAGGGGGGASPTSK
jgi:hypothetical protein